MATFSITGEFITQTARDLWAEGEYDKSLTFLKTSVPDMGLECQIELIEGRSKLIGVKNVNFVSDDWKMPNDYPKFSDMLNKAKTGYKYYQKHVETQIIRATEIYNTFLHFKDGNLTNDQWKKLTLEWQLLLPEAKEGLIPPFYLSAWLRTTYKRQPRPYETISLLGHESIVYKNAHPSVFDSRDAYDRWCAYYFIYEPDRSEIWDNRIKALDRINSKATSCETKEPELYIAELDPKMDCEFGWLLPNGDYYGCLWLGHIKLASVLMPDSENPEYSLEKLGAVKIHMDDYQEFHITSGNKKTTDEQNTKIFEYCIKHNKDYNKYRLDN